jgi:muramoyltetrapeptide carboxypeptidase
MNRKRFLNSIITLGVAPALSFTKVPDSDDEPEKTKTPKYLVAGDVIGITAPAGHIDETEIQPAVIQMESWGFKTKNGATIGKKDFTFGGSDDERASDFQAMLDDPSIKAIMCARGGYGMVRIIDRLNFDTFVKHPKWIIGFSDVTVIHSHLSRNYGIASIHSKMCNSFPDDWSKAEPIQVETINSIKQALSGEEMKYVVQPHPANIKGRVEGILVGGNLKTLETLSGTKSDLNTAGKILFVEDTGEYLYSIDRMFWNLERTGKLAKLKGLIVGGFKVKKDEEGEDFGRTVYDIVIEKMKKYNYPVCFEFPVGHQKNNFALKCGVKHTLEVREEGCELRESKS